MESYKVRFRLGGDIYELVVGAASSGSAMRYVQQMHEGAEDLKVVG